MKSNNTIWIIILVVVLVGGYLLFTSSDETDQVASNEQNSIQDADNSLPLLDAIDDAQDVKDAMEKNGVLADDMMGDGAMMAPGSYEAYSPEKLALAEDGDVVLFFKASWCPSCRALDTDIQNNVGAIPEGVTILEVDYDTAIDLKKQYGVTSQHSLVQVDATGNEIAMWTGSPTLTALLSKIE